MARLAGKVALISGGARGQGAVEARMFVQEGAKVVFGDILDEEGKQVEAAIRAQSGEATYVHLNVTREEDWQRAVHTAESTYGKLDILVNNAGIAPAPDTSAAYAATKGGVRLFTKATAVQHAKDHIRCNSVHPGPIDTPMVRNPETDPARLVSLQERVPMGRLGTAEEVAYGVLYLASDEASFVTGSELVIDGGRTAQ